MRIPSNEPCVYTPFIEFVFFPAVLAAGRAEAAKKHLVAGDGEPRRRGDLFIHIGEDGTVDVEQFAAAIAAQVGMVATGQFEALRRAGQIDCYVPSADKRFKFR